MTIAARIVERLGPRAKDVGVAEVRIGLGYTAVLCDTGRAGVAYTFRNEAKGGCTVFHGRRPLAGRPAADLLGLLEAEDPIEAAVGLACANALADPPGIEWELGDVLEQVRIEPEDDVVMVGYFGPMIDELRRRARSLTVLERAARDGGVVAGPEAVKAALDKAQVALITATSLINHSMDDLLEAAAGCREVAVLGASTPLLPSAFSGSSVTLLSGVVIEQPTEVLQVVSEGGGMRQFKRFVRKVGVRLGR